MDTNLGDDKIQVGIKKLYDFVAPITDKKNKQLTPVAIQIAEGAVELRQALIAAGVPDKIANAPMTLAKGPELAARQFFGPALNALNKLKQEEDIN